MGQILRMYDASTPKLYQLYNYMVEYVDGSLPHKLMLDYYLTDPATADSDSAKAGSWILLARV